MKLNQCCKLNNKNGVEYITFNVLDKLKVKHAFFTKIGGKSEGIYDSLNLRLKSLDDKVKENIEIVKNTLDIEEIYKVNQYHTDEILIINEKNKDEFKIGNKTAKKYDAIITNVKNIPISVFTADCNSVLIYDKKNKVIAAIHSGWKSTVQQIVKKTILKMAIEFDTDFNDVIICIGPSIRKCHFTTKDKDFKDIFKILWNSNDYINKKGDIYHIDLISCIIKDLISLGINIENIYDCGVCTMCNTDKFFSYRYNTQKGIKEYGSMINIISL